MPRLGQDLSSPAGPTANAYPVRQRVGIQRILIVTISALLLRNLLFKDYRQDEIQFLKNTGKSEEEIEKIIPKTPAEQLNENKKKISEHEQLKLDVEMLKEEIALLKASDKRENTNPEKSLENASS